MVDDREQMRGALASVLELAGYGVVTCAGPDDALALLAADTGFSLVVTAASLSGSVDGLGLARLLDDTAPDVAVIVLAADPDELEAARTIPGVIAVVPRAEAVRMVLGPVRAALGA